MDRIESPTHPPTHPPTLSNKVNRLKRQYQREGIETDEEIMELIAQELKISVKKATLVSLFSHPPPPTHPPTHLPIYSKDSP